MNSPRFYNIRKITPHFAVEGLDLDLSQVNLHDEHFISELKEDLVQHRAILFRKQSVSGQRQVDISNALGTVESTFYKHPKSPHPDIFRVSNSDSEGCTQVGRSGWHIDGTFQMKPFMYQIMYFPSVSSGGDTHFIPLKELYDSLEEEEKEYCNTLWMATGRRRHAPIHPLVYKHPYRPNGEETMIFHCGGSFVSGWFRDAKSTISTANGDHDTNNERIVNGVNIGETIQPNIVQDFITKQIESKLNEIGLQMKWEEGDFMITDNLGLAHFASEGTQQRSHVVGLRVLHRTTIVGGLETIPTKLDGRKTFAL